MEEILQFLKDLSIIVYSTSCTCLPTSNKVAFCNKLNRDTTHIGFLFIIAEITAIWSYITYKS